ncbi:hypothetical protein BCR39DRAFT_590853 [Naematelia encephala]|uniref:Uncharacterized protein n=1 Tax=Naematelia encephala TaxID=71784 RepID=A0A1Y2ANM8_9TREE|nr:hypothetical protein BCR39DRAFT_590853 [Naematelia encephala]
MSVESVDGASGTTESDNFRMGQQSTPQPSNFDGDGCTAIASQLPSQVSTLLSPTGQMSTPLTSSPSQTPHSPTSQLSTRPLLSPSQLTDATSLKTDTSVTQCIPHELSRLFVEGGLNDDRARSIMPSALMRTQINKQLRETTLSRLRDPTTAQKFVEFAFKLPRKWRPKEPDAHILEFEGLMSRASDKLTVDMTLPGCSEQRWRFPYGEGLDTVTFKAGSNFKKVDSFARRGLGGTAFHNPQRPDGPDGQGTDEDPALGKLPEVLRKCHNVTAVIQVSSLDPEAREYPESERRLFLTPKQPLMSSTDLHHRDFGLALTLCNDTTVVDLSNVNEVTVAALTFMAESWAETLAYNDHWKLKFLLPRSTETNPPATNSSLRSDLSQLFRFPEKKGNPIPDNDHRFDPEQCLRDQIRDEARSAYFPASFAADGGITDWRPGTEADANRVVDTQIEFTRSPYQAHRSLRST